MIKRQLVLWGGESLEHDGWWVGVGGRRGRRLEESGGGGLEGVMMGVGWKKVVVGVCWEMVVLSLNGVFIIAYYWKR